MILHPHFHPSDISTFHLDIKNEKMAIDIIQHTGGWALEHLVTFQNNKKVVLEAVKSYGRSIEFASQNLKFDYLIVFAATQQDGQAFQYASDELKNNKALVLKLLPYHGYILEYVSDELKKDKEVVLLATQYCSYASKFSLLIGYQNFDEIVEKEGEDFLFSCINNNVWYTRHLIVKHPNFYPNEATIGILLKDKSVDVLEIVKLRILDWFAKVEENKIKQYFDTVENSNKQSAISSNHFS